MPKQKHRRPAPKPTSGFGLLETLLFTFVVGATLVVAYLWISAQKQVERVELQSIILQQANRAIEGFATANFRLPCPASVPGGAEDCAGSRSKGFVPAKTLGLDGAAASVDLGRMRYMVNRGSASDLAAAANAFEPRQWDGVLHTFGQITTIDYCRNLLVANSNSPGAAVISGSTSTPVAFAIAHPGSSDANGDGDAFDGVNGAAAAQMESPDRKPSGGVYDDQVLARTTGDLATNSNCDGIAKSLELIALAADVMDEVNSSKIVATASASVLAAIGVAKVAIGVYKAVKAIILLSGSGATLSAAGSLLATAIGTCIVLVGCAEIPHAAASVAASVISIGTAVVAVVASVAAIVANLVYVGLVLEVAIRAGISTNQSVDLTSVIADALTAWQTATAKRVAAATVLSDAQNAATSTFNAQNSAYNDLYAEARAIVAAANALARPVTTTPTTDLDPFVADAVTQITNLNLARFNLIGARDELAVAQAQTPQDPVLIADKQALVNNAVAAEGVAVTNQGNSRQTLMNQSRRQYCVTTTTSSSTTTNCNLFYDGRLGMSIKYDNYYTTYERYYAKAKIVEGAQVAFDAAVNAENRARSSYDSLVAVATTQATPGGSAVAGSFGAEAILRRADAKGGSK